MFSYLFRSGSLPLQPFIIRIQNIVDALCGVEILLILIMIGVPDLGEEGV
jgi:hypothetical protein